MLTVKTEFTPRELAWFGPLFALFVGIIAFVLVRRFDRPWLATMLAFSAVGVTLVYYLVPAWQKSIYRGWLLSVAPIGVVVAHLLLILLYYGLLTPVGLLMKCVGYDPLDRAFDADAETYWQARADGEKTHRYFRQY